MSKRRRGLPVRDARQARHAHRRREQRAAREAREQRPLPLRLRSAVQEVLPQQRPLSTVAFATTTSGSR